MYANFKCVVQNEPFKTYFGKTEVMLILIKAQPEALILMFLFKLRGQSRVPNISACFKILLSHDIVSFDIFVKLHITMHLHLGDCVVYFPCVIVYRCRKLISILVLITVLLCAAVALRQLRPDTKSTEPCYEVDIVKSCLYKLSMALVKFEVVYNPRVNYFVMTITFKAGIDMNIDLCRYGKLWNDLSDFVKKYTNIDHLKGSYRDYKSIT